MTSFVILFPGRCGGTWLLTVVGSSSYVNLHEERLMNAYNMSIEENYGTKIAVLFQDFLVRDFVYRSPYMKATAFGFSTQFWHVRDSLRFAGLLREFGVRVISLTRKNRVKHALSFLSGEALRSRTGIYHVVRDDPGHDKRMGSFSPDPQELLAKARELELWTERQRLFVKELSAKTLPLAYEDMQQDIFRVADRVYEFLELPDRDQAVLDMLVKNLDDDLSVALENYEDVRKAFAGTEFEQFFDS